MAFHGLTLFFFIFFLLSIFTTISSHGSHEKGISSFVFLNHIQGTKVGEKIEGIHKLKNYLQRFGYLSNVQAHSETNGGDEFDDVLDSAIKTYQKNFNLKATGILDAKTIAQMSKPRCGVADIIDGKTWMRSGKKTNNHSHRSGHFHTISHFSFFNGNPKWPETKFHLTYDFLPGTPVEAEDPITQAFNLWASNTHFTFSQATANENVDIKISFERGDHGDGNLFEGAGGVLAHAFAPTDGRLHFDGDESWSIGALAGFQDLSTVALHEIGHLLGLDHSSVEGAIMWPTITEGTTKGLHADDIAGINALYNI